MPTDADYAQGFDVLSTPLFSDELIARWVESDEPDVDGGGGDEDPPDEYPFMVDEMEWPAEGSDWQAMLVGGAIVLAAVAIGVLIGRRQ